MERTGIDLWVGMFVVAGVAALVMLAMKVGNLGTYNVSDAYKIHAYFTNVGGLKATASIKSAGVLVGRVESITLNTKQDSQHYYEAEVVMSIDKRYQFSKDTIGKILTSGLLGEQYVGLDTGADTEMLKNGEQLKKTQSAMVLEDLIGKFLYSKAEEPAK